jgi:transcriptional regulator with XRE-family HTH domain
METVRNMDNDLSKLGQMLRDQRGTNAMTRKDISEKTGLTPTYIYLVENAKAPKGRKPYTPRTANLLKWAAALGMDETEMAQALELAGYEAEPALSAYRDGQRAARTEGAAESARSEDEIADAGGGQSIARQRAIILERVRELLHDAEVAGSWQEVANEMQRLLDYLDFRFQGDST